MQGFGKVGLYTARFMAEAGSRVVAVSDRFGAIRRTDGLDVPALEEHVDATGSVVGFAEAEPLPPADLLTLEVDVLVPADVESVLNEGNAHEVRARLVVEGANGPTTRGADRVLADRGVLVVPDILANAGGVVVSYFEWVQANQAFWWTEAEVEERLARRISLVWQRTNQFASQRGVPLRTAATSLAVNAVADAHRMRGLYP